MSHPSHKPTRRLRRKVSLLVAAGEGEVQIAHVIGVARETLRKHYWDELENGRASIRAEILDKLWLAGDRGNVGALKHLDARTSVEPRPVTYQGKKVERAAKAEEVISGGSDWGDDLAPIVVPQRSN
jgi:hypothetical protein